MKKRRILWIVTAMMIVSISISILLTERLRVDHGHKGGGDTGSDQGSKGSTSLDNGMHDSSVNASGGEDSQDYSLKIIEMEQQEKDEALEKLFSYMESCKTIYSRAVNSDDVDSEGLRTDSAGVMDSGGTDSAGGTDSGGTDIGETNMDEDTLHEMIEIGAADGLSVTCGNRDFNLTNYKKAEAAIKTAQAGKAAETEFYQVNSVGIFRYYGLEFKDNELFVTSVSAMFDEEMEYAVQQLEKIQAYQWEYTEKGWLIWEKALSRNQEMDMHIFCRILPLDETCREITKEYIETISYFSNNLFLEDWDTSCMEKIEFNDLFDFLYPMATGESLEEEKYSDGIPKEEFESVVGQYFDIRVEQLERLARYDSSTGRYPWIAVGFWNRVQQLQPSFPEVVRCEENEDGTITAYVEAVSTEEGTDCYYAHAVTLRRKEDGAYVYTGNQVDREHSYCVPAYRARREFERIDETQ